MRRLLVSGFASLFVAHAGASLAYACLNDRDVERSEREFKSEYNGARPAEPQINTSAESNDLALDGGMGAGTLLLAGAVVVTRRKPAPSS